MSETNRRECRDCGQHTAILILTLPATESESAYDIYKCKSCGYYEWVAKPSTPTK